MVSNIFLNYALDKIKGYIGTFSCYKIPEVSTLHNLLIINLSKTADVGTHFISLNMYINKGKWVLEYFDPLSGQCNNKYIIDYMLKYSYEYKYITHPVQNILSSKCGFYCMSFVLHCLRDNGNIDSFIKMFSLKRLFLNEIFIEKYILEII